MKYILIITIFLASFEVNAQEHSVKREHAPHSGYLGESNFVKTSDDTGKYRGTVAVTEINKSLPADGSERVLTVSGGLAGGGISSFTSSGGYLTYENDPIYYTRGSTRGCDHTECQKRYDILFEAWEARVDYSNFWRDMAKASWGTSFESWLKTTKYWSTYSSSKKTTETKTSQKYINGVLKSEVGKTYFDSKGLVKVKPVSWDYFDKTTWK